MNAIAQMAQCWHRPRRTFIGEPWGIFVVIELVGKYGVILGCPVEGCDHRSHRQTGEYHMVRDVKNCPRCKARARAADVAAKPKKTRTPRPQLNSSTPVGRSKRCQWCQDKAWSRPDDGSLCLCGKTKADP